MEDKNDLKKGSETSSCENRGEVVKNNLKKDVMLIKINEEEARTASKEYFGGDELAAQVWVNKYALKDLQGNLSESPSEDMHWRLINELKKAEFSLYLGPIDNKVPTEKPVNLVDIYKIATTDKGLKKMIHQLRMLTGREFTDFKIRLPYITPGGIFRERGGTDLIDESNIFCFDFDKLDISPQKLLNRLLSDKYFETQLAFVSPSGRGLKWFIYCPFMKNKEYADATYGRDCTVVEVYRWTYESISKYVSDVYGYKPDGQCKDISRACFLSYDEEAYINPLLVVNEPNEYNLIRRKEFDFVRWSSSEKKIVMDVKCNKEVKYVSNSTIDGGYIWTDSDSDEAHVEAAVRYLEEHCVDITSDYNVWCNIGFAFVNSLGVGGRKYYHRVSSFYSGYTYSETEKKYDNLLVTTRNNIGIATFFKYFTDATGMKVATKREEYSATIENITEERLDFCFASKLNGNLPEFFRKMDTLGQTERAKDVVLMCSLVATGATMHRVKTWHYDKWVSPFLYFGVIAESGAGKSTMDYARKLLTSIERDNKVESGKIQSEYNTRKNNAGRWFNEKRPSKKGLVIGGDFSDIAIKRRLVMNDEVALIYEAEAEQMMNAFNKTDWGLFTTTLKNAFDHEWIEANRGTDNETLELEHPKIAVLLSGTKEQFGPFMENYTTGLGSRFLWYDFDGKMPKHDVAGEGLNIGVLEELSDTVYAMYKMLSKRDEDLIVKFKDKKQIERHNAFFDASEGYLGGRGGEFYKGLIQRSSSMAHRIMVILSVFRAYESGVDLLKVSSLEIEDVDFESSLEIIDMMIENTIEVTDKLCRLEEQKAQFRWNKGACVNKRAKRQDLFYSQLPKNMEFDRKLALEIGAQCKIPESTVDKYLKNGIGSILQDVGHGKYIKPMV